MNERKIHCRHVLTADGWADDMVLGVDTFGQISSMVSGKACDSDSHLNGPVIPGMPNLHSHGFQRMIAGMTGERSAAGDSFWGWREAMYRLANRISAQQIEDCMAWVYSEMLTAGFTSCAEFHYLHHRPDGKAYEQRAETSLRVLAAADTSGMPVTLLPVYYNVSGFGAQSAGEGQRRFGNDPEAFMEIYESIGKAIKPTDHHRLGFAPHSLRAVPADHLAFLLDALSSQAVPVHIHIAEQQGEVDDCLEFNGARPLEWLLGNAAVNENWCLVHATHMSDSERRTAAGSGAVAGLCPTTEADLGDGFFETRQWIDAGGVFGIGSDSNVRVSVSEELRLLEYTERLKSQQRNVLQDEHMSCGRFLYQHAARAGAQALGQDVGAISVGNRADLVELEDEHPHLQGRQGDPVLDSLVFAGGKEFVRSVWSAGKQVVHQGQHVDADRLKNRYLDVVKDLFPT